MSRFEGQLTAEENFEREEVLYCPLHELEVIPASVCAICHWPEDIYEPGVKMWDNLKKTQA